MTAGSRRVPLVRAFQRALRQRGLAGRVLVTDVNPLSPSVHVADGAYRVPFATDADYLDRVIEVCHADRIGLLVPTIDDELAIFGAATAELETRGIWVAASSYETAEICNDKLATCEHLRAQGVAAATCFVPATVPAPPPLPLFVKPRRGRGGVGAFPARTARELDFFCQYVDDPVVQEFLTGPEFTIDLLCDAEARPLAVVPRERVVIRAGVSDRGRTVRDQRLIDLALACARVLPFRGAANIQCRIVGGVPIIFEINARFSGGIPLTIAAGADFPGMLVELALGRAITPCIGTFQEGLLMTSFESCLFLETDQLDVLVDTTARKPEGARHS